MGDTCGEKIRLLLVDDEAPTLLPLLAERLEPLGFSVAGEAEPERALQAVEVEATDAVLLDLHFPGDARAGRTTGGRLLTEMRRRFPAVAVVVFTVRLSDFDIPLERFDERPQGYFAKPDFIRDGEWAGQLGQTVRDAILAAARDDEADAGDLRFPVGRTPEMRAAAAAIRGAAGHGLPVLIFGETGTGKRHAAEAIHRLSGRRGRFESYHCSVAGGAAAETLFGREDSGSVGAQKGPIELADGGTLFLDGIDRLSMDFQDKLLHTMEDGAVRRSGATSDTHVDVRWIAATSHGLDDLVADGTLREELAFRFAGGTPVSLPPLRRRPCDLPDLYAVIVGRVNEEQGRRTSTALRPETREKLETHTWPGNIRELEAVLLRAVATSNSNVLLPDDIEFVGIAPPGTSGPAASSGQASAPEPSSAVIAIAALVDELEGLPVAERYKFLKDQGERQRRKVLLEFIRRLREAKKQSIQHKVLAAELDPLEDPERDLNRIRQFLHNCGVRLTQLDFNR